MKIKLDAVEQYMRKAPKESDRAMTMSDNANLIDNVPIPAGLFDGMSGVQVGRIAAYANQCAARFKESSDALRAERDAAIAHDRQPYPTAAAYEAVCAARTEWQDRAERAEEDAARYRWLRANRIQDDDCDGWLSLAVDVYATEDPETGKKIRRSTQDERAVALDAAIDRAIAAEKESHS